MKKSLIIPFMLCYIILAFLCCGVPRKAVYQFPGEMQDFVKTEYAKQCDKGQVLYNLNCASCHNKKVRGRSVIPDFKQEQLVGYALRVANAKHESSLEDERVTTEELGLIMTFLTYKEKTGVAK